MSTTSSPLSTNSDGAGAARPVPPPSRYESQKRRDWRTFGQYLKNHRPPLALSRCSGAHVLEFLRYLDQFGKTKVHLSGCPFYGHPHPPAPCPCPLRQAWGSLDALVGRLRAAFEENGGLPEVNPFGARAVRLYLREVRDLQSKARGITYEKKKRKVPSSAAAAATAATATTSAVARRVERSPVSTVDGLDKSYEMLPILGLEPLRSTELKLLSNSSSSVDSRLFPAIQSPPGNGLGEENVGGYQYYDLLNGHLLVAGGDAGGGGGMVVADGQNGNLILPLSVFH